MTHLLRKGRMCLTGRSAADFSLVGATVRATRTPCLRVVFAWSLSLALPQATLDAQKSGAPEAPLVLRVPASARFAAMANAGVAGNDADVIFYNPGMLAQARGVALSVQRYGSQATTGSFANVQTIGALSIGVGAQTLDYGQSQTAPLSGVRTGAASLSDGGALSASSSAFVVGAARTIKGVRLGANVKYAEERLGANRDGVVALDLGMNRPLGPASLAVSIQNIGAGPQIGGAEGSLPTRLTVGWGGGLFPLWERWDLGMQTQVSVERDGFVRPAGGVELGYVPVDGVALVFRHGFRLPRERDESLVTAGLGVTVDRFSLDYALEPVRGGRPLSHRLGLRFK